MGQFFLLVLIPIICVPLSNLVFRHTPRWYEYLVSLVVGIVISCTVYYSGNYYLTSDTEIINGEVLGKKRVHDTYEQSYSCNCRSVRSGNSSTMQCDTCYETHYTVEWTAETNSCGDYRIDKEDSTSRRVYRLPDPPRYLSILKGDPVACEHRFTNYVKAAPQSLFHQNDLKDKKFDALIPAYPSSVYDFYNLDRVLTQGVALPDTKQWNKAVALMLRQLGPLKQANLILLFVKTDDPAYQQYLESRWVGGKKNDIIVMFGVTDYPNISWVRVSSWTDNQLFKVQLQDSLAELKIIDRQQIIQTIYTQTIKSFKRKSMKDFKYLESDIEPPTAFLVAAIVVSILAVFGFAFVFKRMEN